MHCYTHRNETAVGFCKTCGRGVCPQCARESKLAITCSPACEDFATATHDMNERAMQIYGIGAYKTQRALPTNAVMPAVMGIGFLGWSAYDKFFLHSDVWPFLAVMGALFLFGAWFGWRKYRQNGLNV